MIQIIKITGTTTASKCKNKVCCQCDTDVCEKCSVFFTLCSFRGLIVYGQSQILSALLEEESGELNHDYMNCIESLILV